jgi:undecaprenyl-diphosphatase
MAADLPPPTPDDADAPPVEAYAPHVYFVLAGVLAAFFFVWSYLALGEGPLFHLDERIAQFWIRHAGGLGLYELMVLFTDLGSIGSLAIMAVMGALWMDSLRQRFLSVAWVTIVVGAAILNLMLKTNLDRPRPPEAWRDRAVIEKNQSYPSGHAMGSAVGFGMLGYVLVRRRPGLRRRAIILGFLALLVCGVGGSRVYLRAHWFSDVIGGFAIGFAWLFFCIGCLEWRRARRR